MAFVKFVALACLLIVLKQQQVSCGPVQELAAAASGEGPMARRPIFFSELKLRAVVQDTNVELRELKRDFMRQMSDVYLGLKLDPVVGFEQARDESRAAAANMLIGVEFASMVMKKHIIQRRLLTGLKMAFVKLLPMQTLVNLFRRYKSYAWLKDQQQVDVRPKFPSAKETQFVLLYNLIEMRARMRAADDVYALTSESASRILQVVQWFLVESKHGDETSGEELAALARNAKLVLEYYSAEVLEWREKLHAKYDKFVQNIKPLARLLEGGEPALINFIDRLINIEALDIDLNGEARKLDLPPTISDEMITNVQKRWLPWYVLKSVEEDRKLLVANHKRVMHLVRLDPAYRDADLAEWTGHLLFYICNNQVHVYGRRR